MMRPVLLVIILMAAAGVRAHDAQPLPLTELEGLRVQNINLERALLERQIADWQAKQAKVKADIETARPGWTWSPETGRFTATESSPKK